MSYMDETYTILAVFPSELKTKFNVKKFESGAKLITKVTDLGNGFCAQGYMAEV